MIHVYTGDGKGKTTAALGQALRACGHGWKVIMIQFMKGDIEYGEAKISKKIPNFELHQFGLPTFVEKGNPGREDLQLAKNGFEFARKIIEGSEYNMVILDELNVAIDFGLIGLKEILQMLDCVPDDMILIITGRYAHLKIIEQADLVSEIREIKHPYQKGILAKEGIDY